MLLQALRWSCLLEFVWFLYSHNLWWAHMSQKCQMSSAVTSLVSKENILVSKLSFICGKSIMLYMCRIVRKKVYLLTYPPKKDSVQRTHSRSLIRIFTGRISDSQWYKVSSCEYRRLWSDCVAAQVVISLRWFHMSEGTFPHFAANIIVKTQTCMVHLSEDFFFQFSNL